MLLSRHVLYPGLVADCMATIDVDEQETISVCIRLADLCNLPTLFDRLESRDNKVMADSRQI